METQPANLLVVDDHQGNRYLLTRRLKRQGYENISVAENGLEALELLSRQSFDLVLLDIMMPEMNGYQVLEHIKSDDNLRGIPVIMISALDELDSVVRCIELGAEDYLPKPFDPVLLQARVGACLEKKCLRDQEVHHLKMIQEERDRVEVERARVEELLCAIFPPGAARELKETNYVKPRRTDDVVVLFCDIVGFTRYCNQYPPEKVVSDLRILMTHFEEIVDLHGLEKIKTIGDAFMATAGLLRELEDPVFAGVRCGLDMLAASKQIGPKWETKVGIHCGPVVAGIMGNRQYSFDLWGDTVNIASRITDYAEPNSVFVSGNVWNHVRDRCGGQSVGPVNLSGKGSVELIRIESASQP